MLEIVIFIAPLEGQFIYEAQSHPLLNTTVDNKLETQRR
jgi:hypothetical protein